MRTHDTNARLAMDFIPSATLEPVITVAETDTLAKARTLMELNNFSQLPVVKGKGNRAVGIVSWQSIGKALLQNPNSKLDQCIDRSIRVPRHLRVRSPIEEDRTHASADSAPPITIRSAYRSR